MDFKTAYKISKEKRNKNKYKTGKYSCLAGLILVAFYAVSIIPPFYDDGLSAYEWTLIVLILLSGIVLLYLERGFSSKNNSRPHDYKSSGGSLHAFSFDRYMCKDCNSKLVLASKANGKVKYISPGATTDDNVLFMCPKCGLEHSLSECKKGTFESSKLSFVDYSKVKIKTAGLKKYKISSKYINTHLLTAGITVVASLYSFYLARGSAIKLILPFAVSYFTFVSIYNLLRYISTKYIVVDNGIIEKSLWQISFYAFEDTICVIKYNKEKGLRTIGLITNKENLFISPMIGDSEELIDRILKECDKNKISEIG